MKRKIMVMALVLTSVLAPINANAASVEKAMEGGELGFIDPVTGILFCGMCNVYVKPVVTDCEIKVNDINKAYSSVINDLQNEMNKQVSTNCSYKPNTNAIVAKIPKFDISLMSSAIFSGFISLPFSAHCIPVCIAKIDDTKVTCERNLRNTITKLDKSVADLVNKINTCKSSEDDGETDDSSGGGSSGGSTSSSGGGSFGGSTSGGTSSNYNPYGSGSSSANISNRAGTNENEDFESFRQQVKQGANADNNLIKDNQNKKSSASQGDTSFYDVVGERPPASQGIRD